jgi:hypothetical protein
MLEGDVYRDLETVGLEHPGRLLGACLADDAGLRAWAGPGPRNTDGNGLLEFSAPLHRLRADSPLIAASVARHSGEALEGWLAADAGKPDHRAVLDLAARSRESIFAIYQATTLTPDRESYLAMAERLLALDPGDWRVYRMLGDASETLERRIAAGSSPDAARARSLVERIRALPAPPTGPLTEARAKEVLARGWAEESRLAGEEGRTIDARELAARAALYGSGPEGAPAGP